MQAKPQCISCPATCSHSLRNCILLAHALHELSDAMAKKFPATPAHPERLCWGCDLYCPATDLRCGNGSDRTPHPSELWGEDWQITDSGLQPDALPSAAASPSDKQP
jgi:hypothetical protein